MFRVGMLGSVDHKRKVIPNPNNNHNTNPTLTRVSRTWPRVCRVPGSHRHTARLNVLVSYILHDAPDVGSRQLGKTAFIRPHDQMLKRWAM